ncbi:MAG: DUF6298 domain-containing protein [Prevotella sp.]|nr:DUF6298 domain-containing protein [Prevotella sp.]
MKKILACRFFATFLLSVSFCLNIFSAEKKQVYIPMDYSTCGYHASEIVIPNVENAIYVSARNGDCHDVLQRAIDYVSSLQPDSAGHRGAVLLGEGVYYIGEALRINTSGVVIRGSGRGKTIVIKRGFDRGAMIYIEGNMEMTGGDTIAVADTKVTAGSELIGLVTTEGLNVGDRIRLVRPSTEDWIFQLGCNDYGGGLDYTGWKPGDIDIMWERTIVAIEGDSISIDAPITTTLDKRWGGGYVVTGHNIAEITECGVENLTLMSDYNVTNAMDEDHCWDGVWIENARDCWVRRINFYHFAGSVVNLQKETSRITVEDCIADEPISEIGGWRRSVFSTRGQQTLFQRCVSNQGLHDFSAGFCAAGPNAFVQCEAHGALGFSGSIGSWATGLLFDIVNIEGNDISFRNLEQFQFGTGWNTANSMLWQCTGSTIYCYSPDIDDQNSANGCWGTLTGNGKWASSNDHVSPRSLFYSQLKKRMGDNTIEGYLLPLNTVAASSPEIDDAMEMAMISLEEPRLTMEAWIDTIPFTASIAPDSIMSVNDLTEGVFTPIDDNKHVFGVYDGHITFDGKLIVGDRYHIPWWNGRVKDSFLQHGAKPAITRFVPGREGTGLTDRIDDVVDYLVNENYCLLDHNYGLWYDLRRTDHERVSRADGDVWAPFYEQPFSRTGEGKAWDGLTLYDLTKPNRWYWLRLKEFAQKGGEQGKLLFHENYFQHNILEAGAHWVDCPWRPVNNVNGTDFPEPVPFTGDKRIFMAEQFYDITDSVLVPLHKQYIRQCLENFRGNDNVVQLTSEEYTGPLHFVRFWLETVAEWEKETGLRPMIALSCTKDAQDAILADPILSKVVDIIDIRYWHYNTDSIFAPSAGMNMAPRQLKRKILVGKMEFAETYKAVNEYRTRYPDKAVTLFAQDYPKYGWAILMAGGSCPNIRVTDEKFLTDVVKMNHISGEGNSDILVMGDPNIGYVVYTHGVQIHGLEVEPGTYRIHSIDVHNGDVKTLKKSVGIKEKYNIKVEVVDDDSAFWLERLK